MYQEYLNPDFQTVKKRKTKNIKSTNVVKIIYGQMFMSNSKQKAT